MKKYIAPEIKVVEMKTPVSILAASQDTLPFTQDPQNPLDEITDPEEIY